MDRNTRFRLQWPRGFAPLILIVASALLVGCAENGAVATPGPEDSPAEASPPAAQSPAAGGDETVVVDNIAFGTEELQVAAGTTVSWDNQDVVGHTVTHGQDGSAAPTPLFDEALPTGGTVEYTFEDAGTYPVTCTIHPLMQMSVVVE